MIGIFPAYNIEFDKRKDSFLSILLDSKNAEITEANKNLEAKVQELTKELSLAREKGRRK